MANPWLIKDRLNLLGLEYLETNHLDDDIYKLLPFGGEEFTLSGKGVLRVYYDEFDWVSWALLQGYHYEDESDIFDSFTLYASGEGVGGALREPRHSYFGNNGYLFYADVSLLKFCFQKLEKYFDFK